MFPTWLFSTEYGGMLDAAREPNGGMDLHATIPEQVLAAIEPAGAEAGAGTRLGDTVPDAAMKCLLRLAH